MQPNSIHQPSNPQVVMSTDGSHPKVEELRQLQKLLDHVTAESASTPGLGKGLLTEDELKAPVTMDAVGGASGSLTEAVQVPRDADFSPGQPIQSSQSPSGLGVIGRRSVSDLCAISDSLSVSISNSGQCMISCSILQVLESVYHRLPQLKDPERARSYTFKHPAATLQAIFKFRHPYRVLISNIWLQKS